jgi:hypothetical protein
MDQLSYRRHRFPPPIIQHAIWLYLGSRWVIATLRNFLPSVAWTVDVHLRPALDGKRWEHCRCQAPGELNRRMIGSDKGRPSWD